LSADGIGSFGEQRAQLLANAFDFKGRFVINSLYGKAQFT